MHDATQRVHSRLSCGYLSNFRDKLLQLRFWPILDPNSLISGKALNAGILNEMVSGPVRKGFFTWRCAAPSPENFETFLCASGARPKKSFLGRFSSFSVSCGINVWSQWSVAFTLWSQLDMLRFRKSLKRWDFYENGLKRWDLAEIIIIIIIKLYFFSASSYKEAQSALHSQHVHIISNIIF